jgi:hypothetical protein
MAVPVDCVDTPSPRGPNITECRSMENELTIPIAELKWDLVPQGGPSQGGPPPPPKAEVEGVEAKVEVPGETPDNGTVETSETAKTSDKAGKSEGSAEKDGFRTVIPGR